MYIQLPDPDWNQTKFVQPESLGRLYVNRFAIDEEDQFEIRGVYRLSPECLDFLMQLDHDSTMKAIQIHRSDGMSSYQLHILWASCFGFHEELDSLFKLFITCQLGDCQGAKSAMVSVLEMAKYDCITKVGCDKFVVLVATIFTAISISCLKIATPYTKECFDKLYGIKNDEEEQEIGNNERNDFSVGEDLETLVRRIKNGQMIEADYKESYLLCLLNKEERRKLDNKDQDFLNTFYGNHMPLSFQKNVDVPEGEWKKTKYKHLKFSRSKSSRITSVIHIDEKVQKSKGLNIYSDSARRWDDMRFEMNFLWSKLA